MHPHASLRRQTTRPSAGIHRSLAQAAALVLLAALCSSSLSGCAIIEKKHRKLTRWTVEWMVPEPMPAKLGTAPLWIPGAILTLTADAFIVNPAFNVLPALDDAMWAWTAFGLIAPAEIVLLPCRAVGFVGIFIGMEIVRSSVPYFPL